MTKDQLRLLIEQEIEQQQDAAQDAQDGADLDMPDYSDDSGEEELEATLEDVIANQKTIAANQVILLNMLKVLYTNQTWMAGEVEEVSPSGEEASIPKTHPSFDALNLNTKGEK